jgi:hypothetical protein
LDCLVKRLPFVRVDVALIFIVYPWDWWNVRDKKTGFFQTTFCRNQILHVLLYKATLPVEFFLEGLIINIAVDEAANSAVRISDL